MSYLSTASASAVERGKRELELTDEVRLEIIFERQCLSRGFATASVRLEAMKTRVLAKLQAAGCPLDGWVG